MCVNLFVLIMLIISRCAPFALFISNVRFVWFRFIPSVRVAPSLSHALVSRLSCRRSLFPAPSSTEYVCVCVKVECAGLFCCPLLLLLTLVVSCWFVCSPLPLPLSSFTSALVIRCCCRASSCSSTSASSSHTHTHSLPCTDNYANNIKTMRSR